jgi:hypothetical protein
LKKGFLRADVHLASFCSDSDHQDKGAETWRRKQILMPILAVIHPVLCTCFVQIETYVVGVPFAGYLVGLKANPEEKDLFFRFNSPLPFHQP